MIKETTRFHRTDLQAEGVVHYQDYIHVVRLRFGGHVITKNNKSLQTSGTLGQFVNMSEMPGAKIPLTNLSTEAPRDFIPSGSVDARRQITFSVEVRQRHVLGQQSCRPWSRSYFEAK